MKKGIKYKALMAAEEVHCRGGFQVVLEDQMMQSRSAVLGDVRTIPRSPGKAAPRTVTSTSLGRLLVTSPGWAPRAGWSLPGLCSHILGAGGVSHRAIPSRRNPCQSWNTVSEDLWGLHPTDHSHKESHGGLVLPLRRRTTFPSSSWPCFPAADFFFFL